MGIEEYNKSVDLYSDNVYRFILKNIRDTEKARDIVQDTYEKLWMNVENVDFAKVKSYIFTAAYHTMIDLTRKEKRRSEYEKADISEHSDYSQYSDLGEILGKAIEKLPESQKSVLMLRDYEGYSYEEIAEITGLNESQVKVYIYRARVFLKEYIGSMDMVI
ncbi:MAG: RNA polymerase subunit sigma-24 [Bacteroidetes bacterium GWF2_38_335]|nr:MAG: RNA polymerase subunit sigma-24 [Bacteroidetes bacterium GWF2_38_335]OFY81256.1 MAG: RNA polymerase subunit sigma-24 [Bacteroidetes bacterium RIFOXYA12_FULL_38_20]HBS85373.1 RNA polymerase sigma factor [Bacteroidales bacterium]